MQTKDYLERMRQSTLIRERSFGDVSSFNFTKKAFYDQKWNDLTTRARGLFIDTKKEKIVARGYNKFFNLDENQNNKRVVLKRKLAFPVRAYLKENGFLGLISYDEETKDLRFSTKSSLDGPYVEILKEIFYRDIKNPEVLKRFLEMFQATMLVEVIEPFQDPHIIEYLHPELVVLDIIMNNWVGDKISYSTLYSLSCKLGFRCKCITEVFETWTELETAMDTWMTEDYKDCNQYVEGYVLEDRNGFMLKVKTGYYNKWKKYRRLVERIFKDVEIEEVKDDAFLSWVYNEFKWKRLNGTESIIELRRRYEDLAR